jgi:nucleotide-binding universal stress UspA family protein
VAVLARESPRSRALPAYRRILVPLSSEGASKGAVVAACHLAAEHGATVTALVVIEVPAELPLDAHMLDEDASAKRLLIEAEVIGDLHGVSVERQAVRARAAGEAIVAAAASVELIVLRARKRERAPIFGKTTRFVLQHAPCRVLLSIPPDR